MGAVDLVVQVESPGAVSRGLQRIGRAGHQVGEPSQGTIYPKHRGDLLEAAVVARRMIEGEIEHTRFLRNPLDVLAQQVVAHVAARGETPVADLAAMVRSTATFAELSDELLRNTLEMLAGRYPSEEFAELRLSGGNRANDTVRPRDGVEASGRDIGRDDPGSWAVRRVPPRRHPRRRASTRRWSTRAVRVRRSSSGRRHGASRTSPSSGPPSRPAPGEQGKMPFWHGDRPGRPLELGRAVGQLSASCATQPSTRPSPSPARPPRPRRPGGEQPAAVPQRAGRSHRCRSRRPHRRRRALPRRDRRLAHLHPQPVRHPSACPVGNGHRTAPGRSLRRTRRVDVG